MVRPRKTVRGQALAESAGSDIDAVVDQIEAAESRRALCESKGEQDASVQSADFTDRSAFERPTAEQLHAERRVMGAAATVCGAAGALAVGPVSGVVLGAAALYAAKREDAPGALARRMGSVYLQASDLAVDSGLQAMDHGVKKATQIAEAGRQRLSREVDISSLPAPVRAGVCAVLAGQARPASGPAQFCEEAKRIREKYPDRVPIICERSPYSTDLPEMAKRKFIVPGSTLCGEFKYMVHKQLSQALASPEQTIYIFVNGLAPKTNTPMSELYERMRSDDGFLYVKYGAENTLG